MGMVIAIAVIGQPIAKEYIDCPFTSEVKEDQSSDNTQDGKEPVSEQVSAFDAVAPTAQVQVISSDFFIIDLFVNHNVDNEVRSTPFIEKISEKLLKVLFNNIIAPNAP